jgi:hypothetical protein
MATLFNTKIKDTYQSLLKLEDNTILTTTSKNITDGLGNASPLYMSTTQVRIGSTSASAMYWDNVNNRLGIGTSSPTVPLEVRGTTNNSIVLRVGGLNSGRDFTFNPYYATNVYGGLFSNDSGNITLGASLGTDNGSGIGIILGAPSGTRTALLQLKGTGSTSATASLLVQNSSGTTALQILDDGTINTSQSATFNARFALAVTYDIQCRAISANSNSYSGQLTLAGASQGNAGGTMVNINYAGSPASTTGTSLKISEAPLQSGTHIGIDVNGNYTNSIGTNTLIGYSFNPTNTSSFSTIRAIQTTIGDVLLGTTSGNVGIGSINSGWRLNVDGAIRAQRIDLTGSAGPGHVMLRIDDNGTVMRNNTFNINSGNGNAGQNANLAVGFYDSTLARLYVKGSGSTSATTSLLVQNSAGTELFRVRDDGNFNLASGKLSWGSIGFGSYISSDGYDMLYNTRQDTKIHAFYVGGNPVLTINRNSPTDYRVGIGSGSGNVASAILEIASATQGFLPPRMTDAQIRAIASPVNGLVAYNTTIDHLCAYQGGAWVKFNHSPM